MSEQKPLPLTILTGFLGSGKTTLINYLLHNNQGEEIAIIENEFGSVGVDGALLQGYGHIEVIELSNGCVCCSIKGELREALKSLLAKIDAKELKIDRILLETTGLADPAPIVQTFFLDEILATRIVLDAVITLVDAVHVLKQLDEHRVVASQIGFADKMILTKTDCVDDAHKERVLGRLHAINSKAQIVEALKGVLPKSAWIDIKAFELSDTLAVNQGFYHVKDAKNVQFVNFSQHEPKQSWNDTIQSYLFEAGDLDLHKIGTFMDNLVENYGNDMLRYKGILAIHDEDKRLIIQGVHKVVGFDYGSTWGKDTRQSLFIIIARKLPYKELLEEFKRCV